MLVEKSKLKKIGPQILRTFETRSTRLALAPNAVTGRDSTLSYDPLHYL